MAAMGSSFRDGTRYMKVFSVALAAAAVIGLLMGIFTEQLVEWAGLVKECPEGKECAVELSKLGQKLVMPVRFTFLIFAALWALEIPHVRLSTETRMILAEADEHMKPFPLDRLKQGDFFLTFYQFILVIAIIAGFAAMMFVPSMLKGAGVKPPAVAAVTFLTWISYVGPLVFCTLRFHHASLTLDTRRTIASLAARLEETPSEEGGLEGPNAPSEQAAESA